MFLSSSCFAYSGNQLLEDLNSTDKMSRGFAIGFIGGATQAAARTGVEGSCISFPTGLSGRQMRKIVEKYLEENPQLTHVKAEELIIFSFIAAYGLAEARPDSDGDYCPYGKE